MPKHRRWQRHVQVNDMHMKYRLVQMVQLNTCTSQLETPRVQENARTQDLVTARSGGDRSWSRAQTARVRWHMRGGSAAHVQLCARPMAQSRMSLCALVRAQRHGFWPALRRPSRKIHSEPCFIGWGGCFFLGGVSREQKESPPVVLYRRHDVLKSFWSLNKTRCPPTGIPSFGT